MGKLPGLKYISPLPVCLFLCLLDRYSSSFSGSVYLEFSTLFPLFPFNMFLEDAQSATLTPGSYWHTTNLQKLGFRTPVSQLVPNHTSLFLPPHVFTGSFFSTGSLKCLLSIHCCLCPQLLGLKPASLAATETVLFAGFKANWVLSAITAVFWVQFSSIVFKHWERSTRRELTWLYLYS